MKKTLLLIFFALLRFWCFAVHLTAGDRDTSEVIRLNEQGYSMRLTNPEQTISDAVKAMQLAKKLDYKRGVGESYRIMGLGHYYLNQSSKSIDDYLTSLNWFAKIGDLRNEGKVYNNIGTLYRDDDYDLALEFYTKSLTIAEKVSDIKLKAAVYLNFGIVYMRKNSLHQALNFYDKSDKLYASLKDTVDLIQIMQDKGLIYFNLRNYRTAEKLLLEANKEAKQADLNITVARIDMITADLYTAQNKFGLAQRAIEDGLAFATILKNKKLQSDFKYTSYQLELKRKNYKVAVDDLYEIYKEDSTIYKKNTSTQITVIREQVKQQARQKENELLLQTQKYDRVRFFAVMIIAGLLLVLVGVLINNVTRKNKTNAQLTALNAEVVIQKDNLDRINHHLEEIIDERTKDLQVKNKKLSDYSSYLSHQIRGPIATLKGLLNLEKEKLVDKTECIKMMNKTVSEIDDKIIEMSDMLHDPNRSGF